MTGNPSLAICPCAKRLTSGIVRHADYFSSLEENPDRSTRAAVMLVSAGCATRFPDAASSAAASESSAAQAIFEQRLAAPGGDIRTYAADLNLSIDGTWIACT